MGFCLRTLARSLDRVNSPNPLRTASVPARWTAGISPAAPLALRLFPAAYNVCIRSENQFAYKWVLVAMLFVVSAVNYADRTSITAVFALLKTDLGFTDVGLGAIGSMFLWSYALASPFAGYLADRRNRGRVVLWSLVGWSVATLLTGLVAARWQLLGMRAVLGLVEACYLPAAFALAAGYHGPETRATALGLLTVGNYVGMVGGGTIGGYLGERFGWRCPLVVLGVAGILLAVGCRWVLDRAPAAAREERQAQPSFAKAARTLFRIPSYLVVLGAGVLTSIGAWVLINWLPLYFHESFAMSLAAAGFLGSSLVSVSGAAAQFLGGVASDRFARRGLHRRMLMNSVLILCGAPAMLLFVVTRNQAAVMFALVFYSICRSAGDVNQVPLICDLAGQDKQSTALGIFNMLNTISGGLGILVAGYLKAGFGLAGVFAGIAGILALDAALLFAGWFFFLKRDLGE